MARAFDAQKAARTVFEAHAARAEYRNLPPEIAPRTLAEAYAAQEALAGLMTAHAGPVAGLKIATTTRVMQELMGIDHPCGGMIFARRVHHSPARMRLADFQHLMIECELAVRVGRDLAQSAAPHTAETVRPAVAEAMPAFELIEDRNADYKATNALSLIADNCWNGGVVLGQPMPLDAQRPIVGIAGRLTINGAESHRGVTDDPFATLAWIANLAAERGRPVRAGMIVITGSVIPTLPIRSGDRFVFSLGDLGSAELAAV
jgi:2-keto-4-pentenoate hydratase